MSVEATTQPPKSGRRLLSRGPVNVRRIVPTVGGEYALLRVQRFFGGRFVTVEIFDSDGWEQKTRRRIWIESSRVGRPRDYVRQGGRESAQRALEEAAGISEEQARSIADEVLGEWEGHLSLADFYDALEGWKSARRFKAVVAVLAILIVAVLVVAIVALVL